MKMSFYFVLWMGSYLIIDLLNIPLLNSQPFIAACIIVFLASKLASKIFARSIDCEYNNDLVRMLEQIYTDDKDAYFKDKRFLIGESLIITVYLMLVIVGLIFLGVKDLFYYGAFAFFAIVNLRQLFEQIKFYNYAKDNDCFGLEQDEKFQEVYNWYCGNRSTTGSMTPMLMKFPGSSYKIVSIAAAILSIVFGIIVLYINAPYLFINNATLYVTALLMYGSLAFLYGVKDLIDGVKAFR